MKRVCEGEKERSDRCITEKVFLVLEQHDDGPFFNFSHSARGRSSGRTDDVYADSVKWAL